MEIYSPAGEDIRQKVGCLRLEPGNNMCADCGKEDPEWASVNLGVFICINCAGIHRRLSVQVSKVRSVRLDSWTEPMLETMVEKGNKKAKERWEATVPPCWVPPDPESPHVCREQWIRAKYERQEFVPGIEEMKLPYLSGIRQGTLMKKLRQSDVWKSRWFVLSAEYLSYFKSYQDRTPKGAIPLSHLNVTLKGPGLDDHHSSMLIVFRDDKNRTTRNIFVYSESGKDMMDWYCAIRVAKIRLLQEAIPARSLEEIQRKATRDFIKWGYLFKMPPDQSRFQKRLFVLDQNSLRYYDKPKDAVPVGEIILGSDGCWVDEILPEKLEHHPNIFMLHVPDRSRGGFPLMAESVQEKKSWMEALQGVIEGCRGSPDLCSSTVQSTYENEKGAGNGNGIITPPFTP